MFAHETHFTQFDFNASQHAIRVGSHLFNSTPSRCYLPTELHWGNVLPFHKEPLESMPARHDLHLDLHSGLELGEIDLTWAESYLTNGVTNVNQVIHLVGPLLKLGNQAAMRCLAQSISFGVRYYNNELLYAKLLYYSMVSDKFTFSNQNPIAVAYESSDAVVNVIDISSVNLEPLTLPQLITKGELILINESDVNIQNPNDWQIMRWIASAGSRVNGAANNQSPHSCYLHWPAIPVTVLTREAGPAAPDAALVSSQDLMMFAKRLADQRQEWTSFNKGLYLAMDLIGMRMVGDQDEFWAVRSCLSPMSPLIPEVRDYNFMFRFLRRFPPPDLPSMHEGRAYISLKVAERVRLFALYTAVLATATTTVMYDMNVTARDLIAWGDEGQASSLFNALMFGNFNRSSNSEPVLIRQPKKAFKLWLGCGVADHLYPFSEWCSLSVGSSHFANVYEGLPATRAPRYFSALCIDNCLLQRPIEWGIVGPRPHVNLASDVRLSGPVSRHGWYASWGSQVYGQLVTSRQPMKLSTYGAQAINAITQALGVTIGADFLNIQHQSAYYIGFTGNTTSGGVWDPPVSDAVDEHVFIPSIFAYEPLSIRSFDYQDYEVRAPVLVGQATGNQGWLHTVQSLTGECVGLSLCR